MVFMYCINISSGGEDVVERYTASCNTREMFEKLPKQRAHLISSDMMLAWYELLI